MKPVMILLLFLASPAYSQLNNLHTIAVQIVLSPDAPYPMIESTIKDHIELRCRMAGLEVLDTSGVHLIFNSTISEVATSMQRTGTGTHYYYNELSLKEYSSLLRNGETHWITSWNEGWLGIEPEAGNLFPKSVDVVLTTFLNEWMKANK